jgi:hypothetical protein
MAKWEIPEKCNTAVVDFTHYVLKSVSCFAYPVGFRLEIYTVFYLTGLYGHLPRACFGKKSNFPNFYKLSQVAR